MTMQPVERLFTSLVDDGAVLLKKALPVLAAAFLAGCGMSQTGTAVPTLKTGAGAFSDSELDQATTLAAPLVQRVAYETTNKVSLTPSPKTQDDAASSGCPTGAFAMMRSDIAAQEIITYHGSQGRLQCLATVSVNGITSEVVSVAGLVLAEREYTNMPEIAGNFGAALEAAEQGAVGKVFRFPIDTWQHTASVVGNFTDAGTLTVLPSSQEVRDGQVKTVLNLEFGNKTADGVVINIYRAKWVRDINGAYLPTENKMMTRGRMATFSDVVPRSPLLTTSRPDT